MDILVLFLLACLSVTEIKRPVIFQFHIQMSKSDFFAFGTFFFCATLVSSPHLSLGIYA